MVRLGGLERRLRDRALVLRVGALVLLFLVGDAVAVIVLVLGVRLAVTVSIQLELRSCVVLRAVRVLNLHRNFDFLGRITVECVLVDVDGDLAGLRVNLCGVALRSLEALRLGELGTLRRIDGLVSNVAVFVLLLEGRLRLSRDTRNDELVFVLRLDSGVSIHSDFERSGTDSPGAILQDCNNRNIKLRARLCILREGQSHFTSGLVQLNGVAFRRLERVRDLVGLDRRRQVLALFRLHLIGSGVIERRNTRLQRLTGLTLLLLVDRSPTNENRERISGNTASAGIALVDVHRVKVSTERRGLINAVREKLCIASVQRERRELTVRTSLQQRTRINDFTGVGVDPLNLVIEVVDELRRHTISLRLSHITRLRPVLSGVVRSHIERDVVRVQRKERGVEVLADLHNIPTVAGVVAPMIKVAVGLPRSLHTKARHILGGDKQPIPVDVLRHLVALVTERTLTEGTVVRIRRDSAKQVPCHMLRTIRERDLGAVVTGQRVTGSAAGATITLLILAEGAVELQRVVIVRTDRRHDSLSDPAVLAELAGHRILLGVRGHLALNPVLQSSLIVAGPASIRRPTVNPIRNLINTDCCRRFVLNLVDCVVRQVGAVDLQTLSGNVTTVKGIHQVPGEGALRVVLLPEDLALHLATLARRLHRVLHSLVHLVHDIILRLLTVEETHIVHAVGSNEPLRRRTLRIDRVGLRAQEAIVVAVDLLECFAVRVLSPNTDLLALRQARVSVKLVLPTERIEERTHLDRVASIRAGDRGVGRRGVAVLVHPLGVHAHTLHRDRTVVLRVRVDRHIAVAGVQHEALDGLSVILRGAGLNRASLLLRRLEGVSLLTNRRLVNTVGIHTRVLDTVFISVRLASLILGGRKCRRNSCRIHNRLHDRRHKRHRQRSSRNCRTATSHEIYFAHEFPFKKRL